MDTLLYSLVGTIIALVHLWRPVMDQFKPRRTRVPRPQHVVPLPGLALENTVPHEITLTSISNNRLRPENEPQIDLSRMGHAYLTKGFGHSD